ncbi:MAG: sigma-54 dependent transcriptional regulator, partial [Holophagales bacterium]|nr:sigma-54 dependent transcriptional regulator [Holophagales bacterium]
RILTVMLRDRGHQVTEAASGEEALDLTGHFEPDLVLLDLRLPGMDGLATLSALQDPLPNAAVIMMTAHGTISTAVEAMRQGAHDYITKPFDNEELHLLIERALTIKHLTTEVETLRDELESRYGFSEIIGISPAMQAVFHTMAKVAKVEATVLLTGESGTGKELVARAIHRKSARASGPFVAVNCGAVPQSLIESEFFGHERGAFTDAKSARRGTFEQANGGTLFLDELGELPLEGQAKLLRALQERQIVRLGGQAPIPIDVRVISATNRDLEQEVQNGSFREDLFWRLNVVQIHLPALRERKPDLPLLFDYFLDRINRELGLYISGIESHALEMLIGYPWPGNVRELENTLCRSMILCEQETLGVGDLPARIRGESRPTSPLGKISDLDRMPLAEAVAEATERLEKRMILSRLATHHGNRTSTAKSLGVSRKTLFNKMRQYSLNADGPSTREPDSRS